MNRMGTSITKERARCRAAQQEGRITYAQLLQAGLTPREVNGAIGRGELRRVLPRVYALGYVSTSFIARLWEAVLFAGPGASLTAAAGAYQRGLLSYEPRLIHVATPRDPRFRPPGIKVYSRRDYARVLVKGLPVAPIPEMVLDLAATENLRMVRRALSSLDFQHNLDVRAISAACSRGRPGSTATKKALAIHQPELAHTNGALEEAFLFWLEEEGFAIPKFNRQRFGVTPDAIYDALNLAIELDGEGNHHSAAQKARDAANQAILESHGITVIRFTHHDVHHGHAKLRAELNAHGVPR